MKKDFVCNSNLLLFSLCVQKPPHVNNSELRAICKPLPSLRIRRNASIYRCKCRWNLSNAPSWWRPYIFAFYIWITSLTFNIFLTIYMLRKIRIKPLLISWISNCIWFVFYPVTIKLVKFRIVLALGTFYSWKTRTNNFTSII